MNSFALGIQLMPAGVNLLVTGVTRLMFGLAMRKMVSQLAE